MKLTNNKIGNSSIYHYQKALLISVFSALIIYFSQIHFGHFNLVHCYSGAIAGAGVLLLVRLIGNVSLKKAEQSAFYKYIGVFFAPKPYKSLAQLFFSFLAIIGVFGYLGISYINAYEITYIMASYLGGSALAFIFYELLGFKIEDLKVTYKIDRDRYDTFVAVIIGTAFLGTTFNLIPGQYDPFEGMGAVLLPIYFAAFSILITYMGAVFVELYPNKKNQILILISFLSVIILIQVASILVNRLLPATWMIDGVEYSSTNVLAAMQVGIIAGFISGKVVRLYQYLANSYIRFILKRTSEKIFLNVLIRMMINGVIALIPLAIIVYALWMAYDMIGLYSLAIAFVCMISNVGVNLVIDKNYLHIKNIKYINYFQRRKLERLSPNVHALLGQFFNSSPSETRKQKG
ncbi:sodium/proton-translocating pyrophosphatase [Flexithrix dorotheae]|uniref:sodium/proton-translocating pyrophosphatase n=1 Tax=Flexithrix dorotheae TaxID=70993 RepID=UPI000379D2CF|nr:sodium/proton-translocating pyrophosphatase [Flexithrix dorotheae]